MPESTAAHIIREARQRKHYVSFTDAEFEYVSAHSALTATEKLIWLNIARKCTRDASLSCGLTHGQIAKMVGIKQDTSYRGIRTLKELGFLFASFDHDRQITIYSIRLPKEGLEVIQRAPNRGERVVVEQKESIFYPKNTAYPPDKNPVPPCISSDTPPAFHPVPPCISSGTPPDKNPILLIVNNNINKHNNHNTSEEGKTCHLEAMKNADALFCEFEKFQNENKQLPVAKRLQLYNARFTQEEMKSIHEHTQAKQKATELKEHLDQGELQSTVAPKLTAASNSSAQSTSFIPYELDGERFFIEEAVKNKILDEIPRLHEQNKIPGEAGRKPIQVLLREIFFYVSKAGSMGQEPIGQQQRFYVARKICQKGAWERPKAMEKEKSIQREREWTKLKFEENRAAQLLFAKQCFN
jgi:hypothetical protein